MTQARSTTSLVWLTAAQTAGQAGTWAGYVAAMPAALIQPHPAVALSVITAAWGIPSAAARLAGGIIDRHGPQLTGTAAWALAAVVPAATHPTLPVLLAVLPVLALGGTRGVLHAGFPVYGWLLAVMGGTGILTSIASDRWPGISETRWAIQAAVLTVAAGEALYLTTTLMGCAFTGAAVFGAGSTLFRLSARALIVRAAPDHQHGRALSRWESVQCSFFVIPSAVTGTLVTLIGLRAVLVFCSSAAGAVAASSLWPGRPASKHAHRRESPSRTWT